MQSYSLQPLHSGPFVFLHFAVYFSKTMKVTAAVKKRPHEVRELKVHTAGKGDSLSQLTLGQLLSGRVHLRAKAGYTANALGDLSVGTHAFGMTRRALTLLSTRSMGHHTMLIWGWLRISKINVQLYAISKRTCTLFEGV